MARLVRQSRRGSAQSALWSVKTLSGGSASSGVNRGSKRKRPDRPKSSECLHRRDQLVPVQQIADAFLTLLEFLAAAARAWIAFISVRETLMVSSDQNFMRALALSAGQPTPAPREPSPGIRASLLTQAKFFQHERSCRSPRGDTQTLRLSTILASTFYPPGHCYA